MNEELQTAAEHLHAYGYCVLKDRIPREAALALGRRCLALHSDPRCLDYIVGDEYYQTLFGMLNQDDEVWSCAFHPDPVALARHFLGPRCRVVEACSKPTWPGGPRSAFTRRFCGIVCPSARCAVDDQQHLDANGFYRGQWGHRRRAHEPPVAAA